MARKKKAEPPAQEAKKPGRPVGSRGRKPKAEPKKRKRQPSARHPTTARRLARDQQIVLDRDGGWMTWTDIARKHRITEKTASEAYTSYVTEIAPLLRSDDALVKAGEFIRKFEGIQQSIASIVASAPNDMVKLSALWRLMEAMQKEITLRQSLGLMPKKLGELRVLQEHRWVADQLGQLFRRYNVSTEALQELHEIMSGSRLN